MEKKEREEMARKGKEKKTNEQEIGWDRMKSKEKEEKIRIEQ